MPWDDWLPATRAEVRRIRMDVTTLKMNLAALVAKEQAAEQKEAADLKTISDAIAALKAQLAGGVSISQEDLDALGGQVAAVSAGLDTIVNNLDAAAAEDSV